MLEKEQADNEETDDDCDADDEETGGSQEFDDEEKKEQEDEDDEVYSFGTSKTILWPSTNPVPHVLLNCLAKFSNWVSK